MKSLTFAFALAAAFLSSASFGLPLQCQDKVDQELSRAGFSDVRRSIRPIDPAAFVRNNVGQYPAYLLVHDAASKTLVGELLSRSHEGNAPADEWITLGDPESPQVILFIKNKRIVGYSSQLLADGAGKSVVLDSHCEPSSVHVTLPPISPPYMRPVISVNPSDCSHLPELSLLARDVEIGENESIFDGACRLRGGVIQPASHALDDDLICECPNGGTIQPELEEWSGPGRTCLNASQPSNADLFATLISAKSSFVNGGFQALVSQLKNPDSVFAQQCRLYFRK
ncbi:MAG: hypothetical protein ACJ763_10130 [Bdellovibrionia bacterium]